MSGSDLAARLISPEYLEEQKRLHRMGGNYGRSSDKWTEHVLQLVESEHALTVLDYGCGKGALGMMLRYEGVTVYDYDPAFDDKNQAFPADLVVCTDVLEHIEPSYLDAVLGNLRSLTRKVLFVSISTRPAGKRLSDGRNAHLIIEDDKWWRTRLEEHGFRVKCTWPSEAQEWVALLR